MRVAPFQKQLILADELCEFIPAVSVVSNIVALALKIMLAYCTVEFVKRNPYFHHIQKKNVRECLLGLIPVYMNLIHTGRMFRYNFHSMTLEEKIEYLKTGNETFRWVREIKKDYRIIEKAIAHDPDNFQFADQTVRNHWWHVRRAVEINPKCIAFTGDRLRTNAEEMLRYVRLDQNHLRYATSALLQTHHFAKRLLDYDWRLFAELPEELQKSSRRVQQMFAISLEAAQFTFSYFKDNREDLRKALAKSRNKNLFQPSKLLQDWLRKDPELITDEEFIKIFYPSHCDYFGVWMHLGNEDPALAEAAPKEFWESAPFVYQACQKDLKLLRLADEKLRDDETLLTLLLDQGAYTVLYFASTRLKNKRAFVSKALHWGLFFISKESTRFDIRWIGEELRNDPVFMQPLIKKNPLLFEEAGDRVKKNPDCALVGLPDHLEGIDPDLLKNTAFLIRLCLKNDKAVFILNLGNNAPLMLDLIEKDASFCAAAASHLRKDWGFIQQALQKNPAVFKLLRGSIRAKTLLELNGLLFEYLPTKRKENFDLYLMAIQQNPKAAILGTEQQQTRYAKEFAAAKEKLA